MIDYGTRQTDLAVRRAEWRLSRVYRQAQRDIDEKLKDWQKRHEEREAKYRQQLADGKITQADFDAWMRGQVFQDKQWQARKAEIDRILLNADREAQRIVNEGKIGVFADNANYIGYDLERNGNVNTGFTLYDQNTVGRLIKSDPQILPKPAPGVQKDKAYTYYNKLMNSAITQGIVQGETIPQIAKRIVNTTGERSYSSAVRNARTAYTGAQNAGRMEGLHQAQELGIKVKKQWMATLDDRTRDTHAELDGQIRDVDEPFEVDGMEIDYPGDPTADPSLVYNCRCTLVYIYPDYPSDMQRRDNETGEIVGDMTYREWEEMKEGQEQPEPDNEEEETPDIRVAETRDEAYDILLHDVGFYEVTDALRYVDDRTIIENANQLNALNYRFHAIGDNYTGSFTAENSRAFVAATRGSFTNADSQNLVLSFDSYAHGYEKILRDIENGISSGWSMPAARENYGIYTITHEYGHILENVLIRGRVDMDAYEAERRAAGINPQKLKKVKEKYSNAAAKSIFGEILDIAKHDNPNFSLRENISEYGRTNYQEAFAETFANSQLGQPNELGRAMLKWLEGINL